MIIREFAPADEEPRAVLVLPTHLASTFESDFTERCEQLAQATGMLVVGYERPGTGENDTRLIQPTAPESYSGIAARTGEALQRRFDKIGINGLRTIITGNSAAALEASMVARAQTVQLDYLIAADPASMRQMELMEFRAAWSTHQRLENAFKKEGAEEDGRSLRERVLLSARFLRDASFNRAIWPSDIGLKALQDIAASANFYDLATYATFVEHTFATTLDGALSIIDELNDKRPPNAAPFKAALMRGAYHSHFNDVNNYAAFINGALDEVGPLTDRTA